MKGRVQLFSMKWKLILSFSIIALIFLGVALFQSRSIASVQSSMKQQSIDMEKRIHISNITQLIQELNSLETSLAESSDVEIASSLLTKENRLREELAKVSFDKETQAFIQMGQLKSKTREYFAHIQELTQTIGNAKLDPLTILETIDSLHQQNMVLNQAMIKNNETLYATAAADAEQAQKESFILLNRTQSASLYAAFIVFAFTILMGTLLLRSFLTPLHKLQIAVRTIAEGDLRHRIHSPHHDELGQLSHLFDHMVERVRDMLRSTQSIASNLGDYAQSFRESSSVTAHSNQEIVRTIQEISVGAEHQAGQTEGSSMLIRDLAQEVSDIKEAAITMLNTSQRANQNRLDGASSVQALQEVSEQSRTSISHMHDALQALTTQSEQISKITLSITDISSQTHILSLNAAIESARAGIHGKGFAVIADEVRQLSEQTKQASIHIGTMISSLQHDVAKFQKQMLQTRVDLEEQDHKVADTLSSFESIDQSMQEMDRQIHQIHHKVDQAQAKNAALTVTIHQVASIAQETAAGVEEVNASTSLQDHAIRSIAQQAAEIHDISQQLFREIHVFKIWKDDSTAPQSSKFIPSPNIDNILVE
ncbi:methyl-accepting chemotaxis protein [Paenibacillus shirakamiensis]|uniref:Methyl-accepting chemotaxis protein n=1 Tax=Paenibacillus shirakamiensis TaxID=1265935 RepID=A0ABS4JI04_9BACL|nr:methyl-accepting chemotaxis protein [Paenibacillus shirakamiensis]MBP2001354.1 methyl-accepting chemotaxis protein [Paenibacillus shirakamiensis]